ncbi:CocE/NonD family hydrolase, partial [Chloroflexota bacterium]
MKKLPGLYSIKESHTPPPNYDRPPAYDRMTQERDVMVPMRDGVHLCVDIYRPDAQEKFPALLAIAPHNKDMQTPEILNAHGPQPAWSPFWIGQQEAGDTMFLTSRGYAHIVGNPRGVGKSEDGTLSEWDFYDLIEWIAQQPWCDGNVGMIGISAFAGNQWQAAVQQPPHLKAIFPYDARDGYPFRDRYTGGVIQIMTYLLGQMDITHEVKGRPGTLSPEQERLWEEAMNNPDYQMYGNMYNLLTQKGQHTPGFFNLLLNPYDTEEALQKAEADFKKMNLPAYTGAGWYAYSYKVHLNGCQSWYANTDVPK